MLEVNNFPQEHLAHKNFMSEVYKKNWNSATVHFSAVIVGQRTNCDRVNSVRCQLKNVKYPCIQKWQDESPALYSAISFLLEK